MAQKKKVNLWDNILSETSNQDKFVSKNVLVLGDRGVGKRTLFDQLHEMSGTEFPKGDKNDTNPGKLRIKGSSTALDYVYLNVKNLEDQDFETMARLGFYIMENEQQKDLLPIVLNQRNIQNLAIIIMLDLSEPWKFMDQLNQWIDVLTKSFTDIEIPLNQLEEMKENWRKIYQNYKEPKSDQDNEKLEEQENQEQQQRNEIPIPDGVLKTNIGIPLLIVCNKSDTSEERELKQQEFIQYHLRQYCQKYGAGLLYTSSKNNSNLDIFYEYILNLLYGFELKHKPETLNNECIFIPTGFDNPDLLKQSFPGVDNSVYYTDFVTDTSKKKAQKSEFSVKDDHEFFLQLKQQYAGTSVKVRPNLESSRASQIMSQAGSNNTGTTQQSGDGQSAQVLAFYQQYLDKKTNANVNKNLKQKAEQDLLDKMKSGSQQGSSGTTQRTDIAQNSKIQNILNKNKLNQNKQ